MENEYIKENDIKDKSDEEKKQELISAILKTKKELDYAHKNFEFAEEDLIDYYTFKIKANQSKLDYLIKLAKEKGINFNIQNKLEVS